MLQHQLRGSFHIHQQHLGVIGAHDGGHIFIFCGERHLFDDLGMVAIADIVDVLSEQPSQQGRLGGVTHRLGFLFVGKVEKSRRVHCDAFLDKHGGLRVVELIVVETVDLKFADAHAVLGQRTRLVGADHRGGAHGLAGVHLAHQVVGLQHAAHAQRQAEGDTHRETFGHRHHDEGDGNHDGVQQVSRKVHPLKGLTVAKHEIHQESEHNDQSGDDVAGHGDSMTQPVKLFVKWSPHLIINLSAPIHLAPFRSITYILHFEDAVPVDDGAAPADIVRRVSGFVVELLLPHRLVCHGLAGERRLVELQGDGFDEGAVGRNLVARVHKHHIAHYHVLSLDLGDETVAHDSHLLLVLGFVQDVELPIGTHLEGEAHAGGQHHCDEDAKRLPEHIGIGDAREILV